MFLRICTAPDFFFLNVFVHSCFIDCSFMVLEELGCIWLGRIGFGLKFNFYGTGEPGFYLGVAYLFLGNLGLWILNSTRNPIGIESNQTVDLTLGHPPQKGKIINSKAANSVIQIHLLCFLFLFPYVWVLEILRENVMERK